MTAKEYYQKGIDLYQAGKYGEAIACFDEAVECSRGAANNCFYKGYDLHHKWKYAEATACFEQAAELNNCQAKAYFWSGLAKIQTEDYFRAFCDLKEAVKMLPELAATFDKKYTSQQWIDKGKEFYSKAQSFKNEINTLIRETFLLDGTGCLLLAKACFDKAFELNNNFLFAYTHYLTERNLADYADALSDYDKLQQCPKCGSRNTGYCEADFVCYDCGFSRCG